MAKPAKPVGQQRSIQSIEIGFTLINALERAEGPLSLKEVAQRAGMTASKAHFYMVSFKRVGLVTQYEDTGHYALGRYALDLGFSALRRLDLVEMSREAMRALSSRIGESVFLSVWGNRGPTIVFKVDGPRRIPMTLQVGYVLPLLKSATGRIFLSYLPAQQTAGYLREETLSLSPVQREGLDADKLKQRVVESGIAETDGLLNDGFTGVSAPVWNHQRDLAGAVTIIAPSEHPTAGAADNVELFARHRARAVARTRRSVAGASAHHDTSRKHATSKKGNAMTSQISSGMASTRLDAAELIEQGGIGGFQIRILVICALLLFFDGFDAQAIGYIAPALISEWGIDRAALGPIFSAGLAGLMIGAFVFGPVADRFGRKPTLMICAVLFGVLTLGCAAVSSLQGLVLFSIPRRPWARRCDAECDRAGDGVLAGAIARTHGDDPGLRLFARRRGRRFPRGLGDSRIRLARGVRGRRHGAAGADPVDLGRPAGIVALPGAAWPLARGDHADHRETGAGPRDHRRHRDRRGRRA